MVTAVLVRLGEISNRCFVLPLLIYYPTSRCNSRCLSCDWWRSSGADDLSIGEIEELARAAARLGTRVVAFSGGEPLLRPDVFEAARLFRRHGASLHLLTSGVLLNRHAAEVAREFSRVIVSLDAATEQAYETIRGVRALAAVEEGISKVRRLAPGLPVSLRATIHRLNFRDLPALIEHAKALAVDSISFLAADVTSSAFGRSGAAPRALALDDDEISEFEAVVERTIAAFGPDFESGFVAEPPHRLRRLPRYYAALRSNGPFPHVSCNAPWTSVVIEANGAVRPCFFHPAVGTIREHSLEELLERELPAFRRNLDMTTDPVCARCVCSTRTSWRHAPWT